MVTVLPLVFVLLPLAFGLTDATLAPGLTARHLNDDSTYTYFQLPLTKKNATSENWVEVEGPSSPEQYKSLSLMCKEINHDFCLLYGTSGNIAGIQICLAKESLVSLPFDTPQQAMVSWTSSVNGTSTDFWCSVVYFVENDVADDTVSKETLELSLGNFIYVTHFDKTLLKISTVVDANPEFVKQNCITELGIHYFYNMTSKLPCSTRTITPWFYMTNGDQFDSIAWYMFGKRELPAGKFDWIERWNTTDVKGGFNDYPTCIYDLAESVGILGFKAFVVKNPSEISC